MLKRDTSLVSVIIPVHNGKQTVSRAVDSVLGQSYLEREVIVVDDGSTDSSLELLRKYGSKIRLVEQKNAGVASARNRGIKLARGEYVAFLDQDDFWVQEKLAIQVEILKKHPSIGLTFSNLEAVNKQGERLGFTVLPSDYRFSPCWEDLLLKSSIVIDSTVLARREIVLKVSGFDAPLFIEQGYADVDFFLRLRELTDFYYIDVCLTHYCYDKRHALLHLTNLPRFAKKYWDHPRLRDSNRGLRDQFVERCTRDMIWRMRLLLESEGGRISKEMLERLNGFHDTFKGIFGESYKRVSCFDSLDLSKYDLNDATSTLLYLYMCRPDLQVAFPEVRSGNLSRLADWGVAVAKGVYEDKVDKPILLTRISDLEHMREHPSREVAGLADRLRTLIKTARS